MLRNRENWLKTSDMGRTRNKTAKKSNHMFKEHKNKKPNPTNPENIKDS